ncbi:MAG TPA: cupredoxin domain-containing protein [Sphingomicrobium sp.]|nr:cupredoxin domain-containing protein [Sphingomicrobium sp.]
MRIAALLFLPLVLLGAQPVAPQAPTVVNVQLANFSFTPKTIVLDHGKTYVLRLANVADGGHDFTAHEFFAASAIVADDRRLVTEGEVEVPPGQVTEIHLTAPRAAGNYHLKCSHSFHKMFGMSGSIVVR